METEEIQSNFAYSQERSK